MNNPKFKVRFYPPIKPSKLFDYSCYLRCKVCYNAKRYSFEVNINAEEVPFMFTAISSDGRLRRDWRRAVEVCGYDETELLRFSEKLGNTANAMEMVMQTIVENGMIAHFDDEQAQWFADRVHAFSMFSNVSDVYKSWVKELKKRNKGVNNAEQL